MRRIARFVLAATFALPLTATAQQSISFSIGGFNPSGTQALNGVVSDRTNGDILVANSDIAPGGAGFLDFNFNDFRGATISGEYLFGIGDKFEGGLGVGFYRRTVVAADAFSKFETSGDLILADLKLRTVPFNATFRWLPLGHRNGIEPYIGGGVAVISWRYTETGDFVANDNVTIINGNFVGSGSATGPVVLGGVRVPVGSWSIGGELKYQAAEGNLPANQGFAGSTIDLGGLTYAFTFAVRF
jgi:hypothetical protein